MKSGKRTRNYFLRSVGKIIFCCLLEVSPTHADLTPLEAAGKQIFQDGIMGESTIMAEIGLAKTETPAAFFPCMNCHDSDGEETSEGILSAPDITWTHLANPDQRLSNPRPGYNEHGLKIAITEGYSANGKVLDSAMPRYRMTAAQLDALIAYIKKMGSNDDTDPGVSQREIRIGSRLPLSGANAAIGKRVSTTLDACIAQVNSEGGLYGRNLTLKVEDSVPSPSLSNSGQPVFAYLSNYFLPNKFNSSEINPNIPMIGPINFYDIQNSPSENIFYLLPDLLTQTRALVDYMASIRTSRKVAILYEDNANAQKLAETAYQRSEEKGMSASLYKISESGKLSADVNFYKELDKGTQEILFLGNPDQLLSLARNLDTLKNPPNLFGLMGMLGSSVLKTPKSIAAKLYLASPFKIDDTDGIKKLSTRLGAQKLALINPGLQATVCAAVDIFSEAVKQAGKRITRKKLTKSMEQLNNIWLPVLPPIGFARDKHTGATKISIIGIDRDTFGFVDVVDSHHD